MKVLNEQSTHSNKKAQGKVNEDYLRVFIEDKSGWSIDGKNRNTDVGIKYSNYLI